MLHEIGGQTLLLHVIAAAKTVTAADAIYCVVGHEAERVKAAVEKTGVGFVLQAEQRGTGHALQMVKRGVCSEWCDASEESASTERRCSVDQAGDAPADDCIPCRAEGCDDDSDCGAA